MLSESHIRAAEQDLASRALRMFTPPPLMKVDEWADKYRELSTVSSARSGRWRTWSFQREPMRTMTDLAVRSVCICGAAQLVGKSELIFCFIGRQIHLNPGPMLLVEPTNDLGERVSKKRIQPMFDVTPVLRELVGDQKSRNSNNTIRAKTFPGGTLNIAGANTPNELCSDPIRDVLIDEVDRCNESAGKEGDIVTLAEKRQGQFGKSAFSLYVSTPSGKKPKPKGEEQPQGVSKILVLLQESDNRHLFCRCEKCGFQQELIWQQFKWDEGKPETVRFECIECGHRHDDAARRRMIAAAEWIPQNPFNGRAGFFLPGMYSIAEPDRGNKTIMEQMVRDFIRAKHRGAESLRAWVNTFLCEAFLGEDDAEQPDGVLLMPLRETYGETIPNGVLLITAGVDVQQGDKNKHGRLEMQVVGWGENDEPFILDYQVVTGAPDHPATWAQLDVLLTTLKYQRADGAELIIERCAVDSGHAPDSVYAFCQPRAARSINGEIQRVVAIKGFKGVGMPVMNLPRKSGVKRTRLWLVATNTAKLWAYGVIAKTIQGAKAIHIPNDRAPLFQEDYFRGLTSEMTQKKFSAGVEYTDFIRTKTPNEPLATLVYALAARYLQSVNWTKLKQRGAAQPPPPPAPAPDPLEGLARGLFQPSRQSFIGARGYRI